jgi:hypothetical protein
MYYTTWQSEHDSYDLQTLTGENTQREDFVEFLTQFNEAGHESLTATTQIESAVEDIETRIRQLSLTEETDSDEAEELDLSTWRKTKAGVVISAKEDCSMKLTLTYGMYPFDPDW